MNLLATLLAFACLAVATPLSAFFDNDQVSLGGYQDHDYPGYDLDLSAQRLVEMEGQEPIWMTELEKVSNFFMHLCLSSQ